MSSKEERLLQNVLDRWAGGVVRGMEEEERSEHEGVEGYKEICR